MEMWTYTPILIAVFCVGIYLLYSQAIAVTKRIAAIVFMFWPGKDGDKATVDSCNGWVRHAARFHESRTYEFVLYAEVSKGDVEVFLLDAEMQPLLKLSQWRPAGRIALDGNSRYYLQWEFRSASGRCELRW